jgi:hypothetical protein
MQTTMFEQQLHVGAGERARTRGLCTARAQFEDSATDQQRAVVLAVAMLHLLLDGYSAITLACVCGCPESRLPTVFHRRGTWG